MMKIKYIFLFVLSSFILSSCNTTKETFWVSGLKTECSSKAGKMKCLNTYKGDNLNNARWGTFYSSIEGFKYEEGYLQKIKVKEQKIKSEETPADASLIKYSLLKVLEKKVDKRLLAEGNWNLFKMGEYPIEKLALIPSLSINIKQKQVSGNGGCNNYSGTLDLGQEKMEIGEIKNTLEACQNKNVEAEYLETIGKIRKYDVDSLVLKLFDDNGKLLLAFHKDNTPLYYKQLNDIWNLERIEGKPFENQSPRPRMEIRLNDMMIMGNDGCNEYKAKIIDLTKNSIKILPIASTNKTCPNMDLSIRYSMLLKSVSYYRLGNRHLYFSDENGNLLFEFLKGD